MDRERRRFLRRPCNGPAEVRILPSGPPLAARIVNVSVEGCLIELPDAVPAPLESTAELCFTINRLPFRVYGIIKSNRSGNALGFYFPILSERVRLHLTDLIQELGEDLKRRLLGSQRMTEAL